METKTFPEWDYEEGEYSAEAEAGVRQYDGRSDSEFLRFERFFGIIPTVYARGYQKGVRNKNCIERRTTRHGRMMTTHVTDEINRMHAGKDLTGRIYDRRISVYEKTVKKNKVLGVLNDLSGSTRQGVDHQFTRADLIKFAATGFGRITQSLGFHQMAYGFHSRGDLTVLERYKSLEEEWDDTIERRICSTDENLISDYPQNNDGTAVRLMNEMMLDTGFNERYIIMLTDGEPWNDNTHYQHDYAHKDTAKAMEEGFAQGLRYIYLTINPGNTSGFFDSIKQYAFMAKQFRRMKDVVEGFSQVYQYLKLTT